MPKSKKKKALITGITGQDGSYLAELLLKKGYEVHGIVRRVSILNRQRIDHIYNEELNQRNTKLFLHYGDITDTGTIEKLLNKIKFDEIYHLAAQSHVRISFDMPEYTANTIALGTLRILEAVKNSGYKKTKIYQASSSEMYGTAPAPQNEETPFHPRSPYACAKIFAHHIAVNYREAYGMFICNGILFNHESPRRGENFITRKITISIAQILKGTTCKIHVGNLDSKRDWGYAPEYVEAMWLMLQQPKPDDFVIATGQAHTVREFIKSAFVHAGLGDYKKYIKTDHYFLRPTEVPELIGDASKAHKKFGWKYKTSFDELVKIMVDADIKATNEKNETPNNFF